LAHERAGVDAAVGTFDQLAEALQGLGRVDLDGRGRLEDRLRVLLRLVEIARTPQRRNYFGRCASRGRQLFVAHRFDRLDREAPDAREVVVDVVLRDAELLQVTADSLAGNPGLAQRRDRSAGRALGELLAVLTQDQAVV